MIRFLVDEDFNNDLVRGLLRRVPEADLVRVQDVGLLGSQSLPVGQVIEDLLLVAQCSAPEDWTHQVVYLPLR